MKTLKNCKFGLLAIFFILFLTSCKVIRVEIDAPNGGKLQDAILFVSDDGNPPRKSYKLGDIDLSETLFLFSHVVDTTQYTHWWLIGALNGDVVYSSILPLNGVDMYTIDPYSMGGELDWGIIGNLDRLASDGGGFSLDWYGATATQHKIHIAKNKTTATLWRFNNGSKLGTIEINLKTE